jgi:lauroyl/myristoyl acyltransferase
MVEIGCVVALGIDLTQGLREALRRPRRQHDLIGVDVNEPVGIERRGQCLLTRTLLPKTEDPRARQRFDADQPASDVPFCDRNGAVGGFVVDEIDRKPLPDEVVQASRDEAFLVVGGKECDHSHGYRCTAALSSRDQSVDHIIVNTSISEASIQKKRDAVQIIKRDLKPADRHAFAVDDALFMLEWPVFKFAAASLPENRWADVAMRVERMKVRLGLPSPARYAPTIRQALGLASLDEAEAIAWRAAAGRTEHHIQVMKVMSAKGWAPKIRLEGEEHIEAALARGKGAILWVAHFCFNTQVTKMALKAGGYRVSHLSRPQHGFSKSQFGMRFLNPLRWNAELQYLDKRIIIVRANPGGSLCEAEAVLAENRIVSITAGAWEGRQVARGPLLGSCYALATGAPDLAQRTGAALLPVVATRIAGGATFRVKIGAPLPTMFEDKLEAISAATAGFLAALETAVVEAPDQWRGWKYLEFAQAPSCSGL